MFFCDNWFTHSVLSSWPCIIICLPFSSFCNIWNVMNFFISIFSFQSPSPIVKLVMASTITNEPLHNLLFFLSNFFLGFPCTLSNLNALVLWLSKLVHGAILTFVLSSPNTKLYLLGLLGIWGIQTSSSSLTFTTLISKFITCTPWFMATYFGSTIKMLLKHSNHGQYDGNASITLVFFFFIS